MSMVFTQSEACPSGSGGGLAEGPYPVDIAASKPPGSHPMYLGKFVFREAVPSGK